jgi:dipeptidyl aminopeptidase/acylaminoacyl peptidase
MRKLSLWVGLVVLACSLAPAPGIAAWPGANGKIAFASDRDGDLEIFVMSSKGSNETALTANTATDFDANWSPDGESLVLASDRDGDFEIFRMNASGGEVAQLTNNTTTDLFPTWTPDGSKIIFSGGATNADLYSMGADGSNPVQLTKDPGGDALPAVSPDGTSIVFQSNRDGDNELYRIAIAGGSATQLTTNAFDDSAPSWDPRGEFIVFGSDRDGNQEIYVMRPDGSMQTRITDHPGHDGDPSVSPDGRFIYFDSDRPTSASIRGSAFLGKASINVRRTRRQRPGRTGPPPDSTPLTEQGKTNSGADQQPAKIDLSVQLTPPNRPPGVDRGAPFILQATNNGEVDSGLVTWTIRVTAKRKVVGVSVTPPPRHDAHCNLDRGRRTFGVECQVGSLKVGETVDAVIEMTFHRGGNFPARITVSSDTPPDYKPDNNQADSTISIP